MMTVHTIPASRRVAAVMLIAAGAVGWASTARGETDANASTLDANASTTQPTTTQPARDQSAPLLFRDDANGVAPGGGSDMLTRMTVSIVLVGVLGVAAWIAVKKFGPRVGLQSGRQVNVVETVYLGPKKCLHLVEINGQRLLLGSTADRVSMLSHLQASEATEGEATFHLPEESDESPSQPNPPAGGEA